MNQDSQHPSSNTPLTVRKGSNVIVSDDWYVFPATICVRRRPDFIPRNRWLSSPAFYDLALSLGIPSDDPPSDILHDVDSTLSRRLNHLEVALPPRTNDQASLTDETPFLSPDSGASSTPWDTGPSSSMYYDWTEPQHQDAPASGEAQPIASSSTPLHQNHKRALAQAGVQQPMQDSRDHRSDGRRYTCNACKASFVRNWVLTRHCQNNCPILCGKRGRKSSKASSPSDRVD
jgi:hypothetical protein